MNRYLPGLMAAFSGMALLAVSAFGFPEPAHAQFGIFIPRIGGFNMYGRGCRHCGSGRHSRDDDAGNDDSGSRKDRNNRAATLAPPSSKVENALLHVVAVLNADELGNAPGDTGTNKALSPLGKAVSKEGERDWTEAIQKILKKFTENQDRHVTTAGDVTEHALEQSLDNAIKSAKLDTF